MVMHGSDYPLVCGLCRESVVNLELGNEELTRLANEIERELVKFHFSAAVGQLYLERGGVMPPIDQILPDEILHYFSEERAEEAFELARSLAQLRSVRYSVHAIGAVLRQPPALVLAAIRAHEKQHVDQLLALFHPEAANLLSPEQRDQRIIDINTQMRWKSYQELFDSIVHAPDNFAALLSRQYLQEFVPRPLESLIVSQNGFMNALEESNLRRREREQFSVNRKTMSPALRAHLEEVAKRSNT